MIRQAAAHAAIIALALLFNGCSGVQLVGGEGDTITSVITQPYDGPQRRLIVAPLRDDSSGSESIASQLELLIDVDEPPSASDILGGLHELLTNALFNSRHFILLEREGVEELLAEQQFEAPLGAAQQATLEGAELLLLGAVTAFNTGNSGGLAFPIPFPIGDNGDFGVLDVELRSAYVAMDLRLVEIKTGRLLATTAVEGRTRKFGVGLAGLYSIGGGSLELPGLLSFYQNTPIEQAMMKMAVSATQSLVESADPEVKRLRMERELEELLP